MVADHALAVLFPDVAPPVGGLPAHVTLLIPCPARIDEIRGVLAGFPPFDVVFAEVRRFPDVVYVAPEPAAAFVAITEALVDRFPGWLPYGGAFESIVPHLTIESEQAVSARLPIHTRARAAVLFEHAGDDRWRPVATFPLGEG